MESRSTWPLCLASLAGHVFKVHMCRACVGAAFLLKLLFARVYTLHFLSPSFKGRVVVLPLVLSRVVLL